MDMTKFTFPKHIQRCLLKCLNKEAIQYLLTEYKRTQIPAKQYWQHQIDVFVKYLPILYTVKSMT